MTAEGEDGGHAELFGPQGRIPAALVITLDRPSPISSIRKGWITRHTVTMAALSPLLFLAYNAALGIGFGDPIWILLTGAMAVTAALILTTYLPLRGAERAQGAPCAIMAGLFVPGAAVLLHQATGPLSGTLALALLGLGLWQRVSGTSTCGS